MSQACFDIQKIRADFPALSQVKPYGKDLVYLDNAASTQKPKIVLDSLYETSLYHYANVHRGLHYLANEATNRFENAREIVARFIHAEDSGHILWTSGATAGFNLLADSLGAELQAGDEIILSVMEHHSNIVPWHFLRERKGCVIKWIGVDEKGDLKLDELDSLITDKTKIISITHMSNILGTINPIAQIAQKAKAVGAYMIADGSQAAVHLPINVQDLGVDFYVFTGHKLYAPTGIGVVYGKKHLLEKMRPYQGGGEMIDRVGLEYVTYNTPPHRFEAGTPPILQAIGLGYALDYMMQYDTQVVLEHEKNMLSQAMAGLQAIKGLKIYGTSTAKASVIAFNIEGIHAHDLATYIDRHGVAIRAGHHCGQPLMAHLGVTSTARASLAMYNDVSDIDALVRALNKAKDFFA